MNKKMIAVLTATVMTVTIIPMFAFATEDVVSDEYTNIEAEETDNLDVEDVADLIEDITGISDVIDDIDEGSGDFLIAGDDSEIKISEDDGKVAIGKEKKKLFI